VFTNNDQLFSCRRRERCRAESAVCQCCWTTTRRRRRQSPSRRSALHAILLCRHVELAIASHAPRSFAILSRGVDEPAPSLYLLNAAALSKPNAIEMLITDPNNHCVDVAVITETHFSTTKHSASSTLIPGYCTFRKDRRGRKGGVWQFTTMQSFEWVAMDSVFELIWVGVGATVVGGLYHPPRPQYSTESLLRCLEACVEEIHQQFAAAHIVLAGDFSQMSEADVTDHTGGLTSIVYQPTRGANILDRIFLSVKSVLQ